MINSIELKKSTQGGFVKITWTANGDLRVKVPLDCDDDQAQKYIDVCRQVVESIGPTKVTLRGKFKPGFDRTVTLYNDSKTMKITKAMSYFPILIEIQEDCKGLKKGTEMIILKSDQIPSGVAFKVLEVRCEILNPEGDVK